MKWRRPSCKNNLLINHDIGGTFIHNFRHIIYDLNGVFVDTNLFPWIGNNKSIILQKNVVGSKKFRRNIDMRRITWTLVIVLLMVTITASMVLAESSSSIYSKIEIEKIVREKLQLENKLDLKYGHLSTQDLRQKRFWYLEFSDDINNIYVTANAESGEIINFHKWGDHSNKKPVTILEQMAKKNAIRLIQSMEPQRFKETEEVTIATPSIGIYDLSRNFADTNNYYFYFMRKIAGEFFPENYFKVQVSGVTGEVMQYEMAWDDAIYEADRSLVSETAIRKVFEGEDQIKLKYIALGKNNKDGEIPYLTPVYYYLPKESGLVNAIDGKFLKTEELYNRGYYLRSLSGAGGIMEDSAQKEMAADSGGEVIPEQGVVSKEKIEKIVLDILKKELDTGRLNLQGSSYSNYFNGIEGKYWRLNWLEEETGISLNVVADAVKADILSVDYYKSLLSEKPVARIELSARDMDMAVSSIEIVEKKDINFGEKNLNIDENKIKNEILGKVQNIFPQIKKNEIKFELQDVEKEKNLFNANSPRYIDDIPYDGNRLNITYNYKTKEIMGVHYRWNEIKAEASSQVLDKKIIEKQFYDEIGFEKYLIQLSDQLAGKEKGLDIPLKELLPVYGLKDFNFTYINAITGKFLKNNGEEYIGDFSPQDGFTDVINSRYEREIVLMNKMGVLKEDNNLFYPNDILLRQDAIKWIVELGWMGKAYSLDGYYEYYNRGDKISFKDMSKDNPYYPYILAAIKNGILDESQEYFRPEEEINKLEITKWILGAMKQKRLAEFTEIFINLHPDNDKISDQDIGYIALAKYYQLYDRIESGQSFNPDKVFQRDEFVKVLYDILNF